MVTAEQVVTHALDILHTSSSGAINDESEEAASLRILPLVVITLERERLLLSQAMIDRAYLFEKAYQQVLVNYNQDEYWAYGSEGYDIRTPDVLRQIPLAAADGSVLLNAAGENLVTQDEEIEIHADEVALPITHLLAYELRTIIHQDTQQINEMRQIVFESKTFLRERMNRITRPKPNVLSGFDPIKRARLRRLVNLEVNRLDSQGAA